jgi:Protein of unknown function (DUF2844)
MVLSRYTMKFFNSPGLIRIGFVAGLASLAAFSLPAFASLGGNLDSVSADRLHMKANLTVTSKENYNVHQIQAPEGTIVEEYVSSTGTVFAVAWRGHFMPDMQQLMGTYFNQYSAALQSQQKHFGHQPLNIKQSGLVIQTGGHMRDYFGRAYIPSLLPSGLDPEQIQ